MKVGEECTSQCQGVVVNIEGNMENKVNAANFPTNVFNTGRGGKT